MENKQPHILLKDLEVYRLSRELSKIGWRLYSGMDWHTQKIIGDQFITATDSFGANVAEGYSRYHYLDRIKFFYMARASLREAVHWSELLKERNFISNEDLKEFTELAELSRSKLQNFIASIYKVKEGE